MRLCSEWLQVVLFLVEVGFYSCEETAHTIVTNDIDGPSSETPGSPVLVLLEESNIIRGEGRGAHECQKAGDRYSLPYTVSIFWCDSQYQTLGPFLFQITVIYRLDRLL